MLKKGFGGGLARAKHFLAEISPKVLKRALAVDLPRAKPFLAEIRPKSA